jgi:hypothetical protein
MRWIEKCKPRLVLCIGLRGMADFLYVTRTPSVPKPHVYEINGHAKRIFVATDGVAPVAVVPHLSGGTNGLNSNAAIAEAARYIRERLRLS